MNLERFKNNNSCAQRQPENFINRYFSQQAAAVHLHFPPANVQAPAEIDKETTTILRARDLARKHPEVIKRVFARFVNIENAIHSIRDLSLARDVILAADELGLL